MELQQNRWEPSPDGAQLGGRRMWCFAKMKTAVIPATNPSAYAIGHHTPNAPNRIQNANVVDSATIDGTCWPGTFIKISPSSQCSQHNRRT